MASERFSLTVLPVSVDPARGFHVSLHIAPRLTPSAGKTQLGDFPLFSQWGAAIAADARIRLFDQGGTEIVSRPLLDKVEPRLWPFVFPEMLRVGNQSFDTFQSREWLTFPAKTVHDTAMTTQFISFLSSPDKPPLPSLYFLTPEIARFAHVSTRPPDSPSDFRYDESKQVTPRLDQLAGKAGSSGSTGSVFDDMVVALYRTRRYYEQSVGPKEYRERPTGAASKPLDRPKPDFHDQVAHLGDQPELLRRLGLVIDLQVGDLARLAAASELYAEIDLPGFPGMADQIHTPVRRDGTNLLTVPVTDDWQDGGLKLGDANRFAVLILDPDGSALKLDRFLWTLPRLLWVEFNGDPVHAAPPAMRVGGLTVVQNGNLGGIQTQLGRIEGQLTARGGNQTVRVSTEDVTRGFRAEVWDDTAGHWFSLHERLIDTSVDGFGKVFSGVRSAGFIQGTGVTQSPDPANDALHVHDALFGWSGWSLSAPRPGPRVRHDKGDEVVEPTAADPNPITPVHTWSSIAPGTLPRLRYGRSYAFRAWSVDLAGNSPPHPLPLGGAAQPFDLPPGPDAAPESLEAAANISSSRTLPSPMLLDRAAAILARNPHKAELPAATVRALKLEARRIIADEPQPDILGGRASEPSDKPITGVAAVDAIVRARFSSIGRNAANTMRPVDVAARMLRNVAESDAAPEPFAELRASQLVAMAEADKLALSPDLLVAAVTALRQTVTPLVPYYRWEPVPAPVVVARNSFSQAESARHLVIRSGVELSAPVKDGGTISVDNPATYAALMTAAHPELVLSYRPTSERHIAPPKGSLEMAELHSMMDAAIGSTDPAIRKKQLAIALRDDGTLLDQDVVDEIDPSVRHPQPGISLAAGPEVPAGTLKNLDDLKRGEPLTPGQYVVHDVDDLVLPYLPDPLAHGVAMVFPDAGKDRGLPPILAIEGVASRYLGNWPNLEPFRLVLETATQLTGKVDGRVITIGMPPGTKFKLRLSSTMTRTGLELLGLWRLLPQALRDNPILYEPAIRGWFWAFTPTEDVTLVHAVPRPLEAPRVTILLPFRSPGDTEARLIGALDCHGPSTDRIDAEATWTEWIDDLAQPAPSTEVRNSMAFTTSLDPREDLVVLTLEDVTFDIPGYGPWRLHGSKHQFNDTKHRLVDYAFRATTRFREYFPPTIMDDPEQRSILGAPKRISMPSTVRPPAPLIHSVLPLFRWEEATEPSQPFATRRRRRAGFRIYIERPWYASGEGELLGVLVAPAGNEMLIGNHASQWGSDPVWLQAGPKLRAIYLELTDLLHLTGFDDRPVAARPVGPPALLPLREANGNLVQVLGYKPEFQPDRNKWFVDVAIDPGTAVWPFVRLAVSRYQPESLPDCHLSPVVHCVFTQLSLERTATLSRPDLDHARLVVSGPVGFRFAEHFARRVSADPAVIAEFIRNNRRLLARLEQRDPAVPTDLGWHTEVVTELAVVGFDPVDGEFAWMGMLNLPEPIDPARPGAALDWRVTIEEWEALESDPMPFRGDSQGDSLTKEWRIVYADHLSL
ncbi:MAG: hypothetical protein QOC84_2062 [Bradyrhizobium sp.]|jgi:hypothetical protein|nr:hypothetical protein [Bradyrhizobium sp.]